jgi:prepilin-type N-terminal cleavage/methylation domain-containing protein
MNQTAAQFVCSPAPVLGERRAFSIIELLVALSILLAITAVVLPFAGARVREAMRADAADQIEAAIWSARATAQRDNAPVRILAVPTQWGTSIIAEPASRRTTGLDDRGTQSPLAELGNLRIRSGEHATDEISAETEDPSEGEVTLATMLPDGAAVVATGLSLVDGDGGTQQLRIDPVALSVTTAFVSDEEPEPTDDAGPGDEAP